MLKSSVGLLASWLLSGEGGLSDFRVSICAEVLAVAAGCDICCILQCSSDGRVSSPICCPYMGTTVNALVT